MERLRSPDYIADCDWFGRGSKARFVWFIGHRNGPPALTTANDHRDLIRNLRKVMQRRRLTIITFEWRNDGRVQTVRAKRKRVRR